MTLPNTNNLEFN